MNPKDALAEIGNLAFTAVLTCFVVVAWSIKTVAGLFVCEEGRNSGINSR